MRFTWTEEQQLLRSTLHRYVTERWRFEDRCRRVASGFDPQIWMELAQLGVLGMPFDEQYGGGGGSPLDTLIVMEAFGRALVVEPYLPCVILGGGLLRSAASARQQAQFIPPLINGELRLAVAFAEEQSRFNLANVAVRARAQRDGYVLSGRKIVVYGAPECDWLIVTARTSGDMLDSDGISLFIIPVTAENLRLRSYTSMDGISCAEVLMDEVLVPMDNLLGEADCALPAVQEVMDQATAAICGEAVGAIAALNEKCVEYAKTRQAFGKSIATFQVIGHRLVDMRIAYEQAAAITLKAAVKLTSGASDRARAVSACKVKVGQEAAFVAKSAVQLHGAIGITDELDISHYFKRLMAIQTLFGSTDHHLRRYVALGSGESATRELCGGH